MAGALRIKNAINNLRNGDFYSEVFLNDMAGYRVEYKFAHNATLAISTLEDIWDVGGTKQYQTEATTLSLTSASAEDNAAGSGARTVKIFGLNSGYLDVNETITPTGTTPTVLNTQFIRIYRMRVLTAGSSATNVGCLSLTSSGGLTEALINGNTENTTLMSHYTIPVDKKGVLYDIHFSTGKNKDVIYDLQFRPFGQEFFTILKVESYQNFTELSLPLKVEPKTDIRVRGISDNNNTESQVQYVVLLKDVL